MYLKKISVEDRLPELNKFVTTIDENGEHRVYRLTEHGWNMRDSDGINSPNNNLKITHWLDEYSIIDNKVTLLEEELECVHMYLDDLKVPRRDVRGEEYSIVGRIKFLGITTYLD